MYSNFFFLLLVFLIPTLSQDYSSTLTKTAVLPFLLGLLLYFFTLFLILFQNYYLHQLFKIKKNKMLLLIQTQLILFLITFFFLLKANQIFLNLPIYQFCRNLLATLFYLGGLWFFYYTRSFFFLKTDAKKAFREISFILPFVISFLLLSLGLDLFYFYAIAYFQSSLSNFSQLFVNGVMIVVALLSICLIMFFFPFIIQSIWQCKELGDTNEELAIKLETICKKAKFKHAGIKTWGIFDDSLTAAIVGVLPRVRYIIFTKKILTKLSFNALSAILAHEIGHSYRKHLLIYPFIIAGLFFVLNGFEKKFENILHPFIFFIAFILVLLIYFRLVFGFFSRIFERQADLHVYVLKIDPGFMIEALDQVAILSGNIHQTPCWHHHSIQERIHFLEETIKNPKLIDKHHAFVKKSLFFYLITSIITGFWWGIYT